MARTVEVWFAAIACQTEAHLSGYPEIYLLPTEVSGANASRTPICAVGTAVTLQSSTPQHQINGGARNEIDRNTPLTQLGQYAIEIPA